MPPRTPCTGTPPEVTAAGITEPARVPRALGFGATAGRQWTWIYGLTVRLGGGGMYYLCGSSPAANAVALSGPQRVADASIGWAF